MNILEVVGSLPEGFHDAELLSVNLDLSKGVLRFELDVCMGSDDGEEEVYRRGLLTVDRPGYFVMEPPGITEPSPIDRGAFIGFFVDSPELQSWKELPPHPEDHVPVVIFMSYLNTFIRFSAGEVTFEWLGDTHETGLS